jgi:uncharacterized protein YlzI (FlbEa/FlbD family)
MTPERLRECLDTLRWWAPEMAEAMGANPRTTARWISGKNPIPDNVGEWIEKLVAYEEAMLTTHPPPEKPVYVPRADDSREGR